MSRRIIPTINNLRMGSQEVGCDLATEQEQQYFGSGVETSRNWATAPVLIFDA